MKGLPFRHALELIIRSTESEYLRSISVVMIMLCVAGGVKTRVEAKRSYANYVLPYKSANTSRRKVSDLLLVRLLASSRSNLVILCLGWKES